MASHIESIRFNEYTKFFFNREEKNKRKKRFLFFAGFASSMTHVGEKQLKKWKEVTLSETNSTERTIYKW